MITDSREYDRQWERVDDLRVPKETLNPTVIVLEDVGGIKETFEGNEELYVLDRQKGRSCDQGDLTRVHHRKKKRCGEHGDPDLYLIHWI